MDRVWEEEVLQQYFDHMSDLLLNHGLWDANNDNPKAKEAKTLAQARTFAVLGTLDADRKSQVIKFLSDAGLVNGKSPILSLERSNLADILLRGVDPSNCNLRRANLSGATIRGANLNGVNLTGAVLTDADFYFTRLKGAKLDTAILTGANLANVNLSAASLHGAEITDAVTREAMYTDGEDGTAWPGGIKPKAHGAVLVDESGKPV